MQLIKRNAGMPEIVVPDLKFERYNTCFRDIKKELKKDLENRDKRRKFGDKRPVSMKDMHHSYDTLIDEELTSVLNDSGIEAAYMPAKSLTFFDFLNDKMMIISVIKRGIPYSFFEKIKEFTTLSESDWAGLLNLSSKSLQRYKQGNTIFKPIYSEKIIEMAELTKMGIEVFGDIAKFKLWLETSNFALGSLKPIDLVKSSYGKELVISELTRINYGIFV